MLAAIGLDRSTVYIANAVPWRPPGNRDPSAAEMAACLPFLLRQIELAAPRLLVCLGRNATHALLGTAEPITRLRGRWQEFSAGGCAIRTLPMFHPAYLLRSPASKRQAWQDLQELRLALEALATPSASA